MIIPSYNEYMIASSVWFHLERGVDISEIVRYFHPEFEMDILYKFYPRESVDEKAQKAIRLTVSPLPADASLSRPEFTRVSLVKACGAFFDKDDPRKQGHVYFKDKRYQMQAPVPDIADTNVPEIMALAKYHFILKDIRHLIENDVYSSFRQRCRYILHAEGSTPTNHQTWSLNIISALNDLYLYALLNDNEDLMDFTVKLFTIIETEFFSSGPQACIRHSSHLIQKGRLIEDCTGNGTALSERSRTMMKAREDFLAPYMVEIVHSERVFCRSCQVPHCPYREILGTQLREYNKTHPHEKRRTSGDEPRDASAINMALVGKIKPYLDALMAAGYITKDYLWIKDAGHTNYQAAYIAQIIHRTIPEASQNAIGKLFGIKSISTYLAKIDKKESIKRPLENLFTDCGLKLVYSSPS